MFVSLWIIAESCATLPHEDVIKSVTKLPVTNHVYDLSLPDDVRDSLLLRSAGALVGLSEATTSRSKQAHS